MEKKNLVIFFPLENTDIPLTHPYQERLQAEKKQEILLESLSHKDISIYMARGSKSYLGNHIFTPQFQKNGTHWKKCTSKIEADLVLGFALPQDITRKFNTMSDFTRDKSIFEKVFPEYALHSRICKNYSDIQENFPHIETSLKVLKPLFGTRSKGIFIKEKLPLESEIEAKNFPYILQEFFDTSGGFYEFPGLHDFRVVMLNGEIIGKFLRQPEKGKYTANSFRRGGFIDLENWDIPRELQVIIDTIESYCCKRFKHRYYSIDLGMGPDKQLKVFEMNSAPGLTNEKLSRKLGEYIAKNILKVG